MKETNSISRNISNYKGQNSMSNRQFIIKLMEFGGNNVSERTISKWESGESFPEMQNCIALSKMLNCTLDELLKTKVSESIKCSSRKFDLFSNPAKQLLAELLYNKSTFLYKLSVSEKDWVADFSKRYTLTKARQEYEQCLKNTFQQERLADFLKNKEKDAPLSSEEIFNYLNVEVQESEGDEVTQLYPRDRKNVKYYASIESVNINIEQLQYEDSDTAVNEKLATENDLFDINFDFTKNSVPSTIQTQMIENLATQLDSALKSQFKELFDAKILSPDVHSAVYEFVDCDGDQRLETCIMDFIIVEFKILLSDFEIENFLKEEFTKTFFSLKKEEK